MARKKSSKMQAWLAFLSRSLRASAKKGITGKRAMKAAGAAWRKKTKKTSRRTSSKSATRSRRAKDRMWTVRVETLRGGGYTDSFFSRGDAVDFIKEVRAAGAKAKLLP